MHVGFFMCACVFVLLCVVCVVIQWQGAEGSLFQHQQADESLGPNSLEAELALLLSFLSLSLSLSLSLFLTYTQTDTQSQIQTKQSYGHCNKQSILNIEPQITSWSLAITHKDMKIFRKNIFLLYE